MAEVSHASKQWAEAHKISLFMIATVVVELRAGGAQAVLDAPQSIVFDVTAEQWSPPAVALRRIFARSFRTANAHPDIVGVLPTTFYVQDAQLAAQTNLPHHRRRPRIPGRAGGAALDEHTKKALYSLLGVCMGSINSGAVFRIPEDANQVVPDLGRLERRGKGWKWTPSVASSHTFFGSPEFAIEDAAVPPLVSFTAYHRL